MREGERRAKGRGRKGKREREVRVSEFELLSGRTAETSRKEVRDRFSGWWVAADEKGKTDQDDG